MARPDKKGGTEGVETLVTLAAPLGVEFYADAGCLFRMSPPQVVIPPGATSSQRFWINAPLPGFYQLDGSAWTSAGW